MVLLAVQESGEQTDEHGKLFDGAEVFFCIIFTIEMLMRIAGIGFIAGNGSYLADRFNFLDIVVVLLAWIPIIFDVDFNLSFLRTVRLMRAVGGANGAGCTVSSACSCGGATGGNLSCAASSASSSCKGLYPRFWGRRFSKASSSKVGTMNPPWPISDEMKSIVSS